MRGGDHHQEGQFSYISLESRIPQNHPLRPIRKMVDQALRGLEPVFARMYADDGRRSIPPERLLRALLLQILYSIPSERKLIEHLDYNLLFRWFVGLGIDDEVWHPTTFTKNRDRLLEGEIADLFFAEIGKQAKAGKLLSREHFTVDGTLLEACASLKSFRAKGESDDEHDQGGGRNPHVDFHGEKRTNKTHESKTDPDAMLARKGNGKEAKLCYGGHLLTDNRHGLIVDTEVTKATGTAECDAAVTMAERSVPHVRATMGADKAYDKPALIETLRAMDITPHVACTQNTTLDERTTRHEGYAISQRRRKMIEECFGWMKVVGLLRKLRHRGIEKVAWIFRFTAAAYNLVRIRRLLYEAG